MKRRKGFTLVEVILTLALISIVVLGGTNLINICNKRTSIDYEWVWCPIEHSYS